jgi:hypothetical protein
MQPRDVETPGRSGFGDHWGLVTGEYEFVAMPIKTPLCCLRKTNLPEVHGLALVICGAIVIG